MRRLSVRGKTSNKGFQQKRSPIIQRSDLLYWAEELLHDFQQIPNLSRLDRALANAYRLQQNDRIEEAIQSWRFIANSVEATDNNLASRAWKSIGYLYLEGDNRQEALSAFNSAIRLKSDDAEAYTNRGNVRSLLGEYEPAIADYDDAIRLGANSAEIYSRRANVKNALGRYDEAIADCDAAIYLNPNYARVYAVRAEAKVGSENISIAEARVDFQIASELAAEQEQEDLRTRVEQRLQEL